MAKNLSIASIIEKNKVASSVPFLMLLEVDVINPTTGATDNTLFFVNNDEDVTYNGNLFLKGSFDLQTKSEVGSLSTVALAVVDYENTLQGIMQQYNGGIGFAITLYIVNAGDLSAKPENVEFFNVLDASSKNYVVSWTLGAENILSKRFPSRLQFKDQCSWKYKGTECGYVGAIVNCDLTLNGPNGCAAHNNEAAFGAFPGINPNEISY